MLIGSNTGLREARWDIHSPSSQEYDEVATRDAVAGGNSVANAKGSARSVTDPSAPCTRNLYSAPSVMPGQMTSDVPPYSTSRR
ncbi:Uncharacterised protein [Mycobacteroides abscessus subsp. abscessus]|nr:Uncharacterised protein [Mycobacteroides abscessus subsp. abscessus]